MDDILPLAPTWRVCGRVRTMAYGPRSGMRHAGHRLYTVAEMVEPGDVVVLAAAGTRGWLLGENMAHFCINHGLGGIVTDGRVRDALELAELPLPIFAAGTSARPASSEVEIDPNAKVSVVTNGSGKTIWRVDQEPLPPIAIVDPNLATSLEANQAFGLISRCRLERRSGKSILVSISEEVVRV
jgi:regulator of RNase E activity RraA